MRDLVSVLVFVLAFPAAVLAATPVRDGDVLALDANSGVLFSVDPTTGSRAILSDFGDTTQGPVSSGAFELAVDTSGTILATGYPRDALFTVDPTTGYRTILSDFEDATQGPTATDLTAIAVNASGTIVVAGYTDRRVLFTVDPTTGYRTILSDFADATQVNVSPPLDSLWDLAIDSSGKILAISPGAIFSVDPVTGSRTILGQFGRLLISVAVDHSGTILVVDYVDGTADQGGLYTVDPTNGSRTILSDFGDATQGPTISGPETVAVDASGTLVVAGRGAGSERILAVNPTTGSRTQIASFVDGDPGEPRIVTVFDDGIDAFVDRRFEAGSFVDESTIFSSSIDDGVLGPSSFGTILARARLFVHVEDVPPPSIGQVAGFRVTTSVGTGIARMTACLGSSLGDPRERAMLSFPGGTSAIITCSSLNAEVLVGPIEILLEGSIVVTVPTGATVTVTELTDGQFEVRNSATSTGPIVVGVTELGPGESLALVAIDVKPGSFPNPIQLNRKGVVSVAILTTPSFDATTVDPGSVCFGDADDDSQRDCTEAHGAGHLKDVDLDLDVDLVLHYEALQTGIELGDTQACLSGETMGGELIAGCDSVAPLAPGAGCGLLGVELAPLLPYLLWARARRRASGTELRV